MSKGDVSQKDKAMASFMKEHGPRAPQSWNGCGANERKEASKMGTTWMGRSSSTFERGMLGGVLVEKLGLGRMPDGFR